MTPITFEAFLDMARRDAALQERVRLAMAQADPQEALRGVARHLGFAISGAPQSGELGIEALEAVAGGLQSPAEMFAEFKTTGPRDSVIQKDSVVQK